MKIPVFPRKLTVALFAVAMVFGIVGTLFICFSPTSSNPYRTLGQHLSFLSFPVAAILLAIIGYQSHIRKEYLKSLFHSYIIVLSLVASSCFLIPMVLTLIGYFWLSEPVSLIETIRCVTFLLQIVLYNPWTLILLVIFIAVVLFFLRKMKSKRFVSIGYGLAILVFGVSFCTCFYLGAKAITAGMAALPCLIN